MNVESSTTVSTSKTDTSTTTSSSTSSSAVKDSKAFKDELEEVKASDTKNVEQAEKTQDAEAKTKTASDEQGTKKTEENTLNQFSDEKLLAEKEEFTKAQENKDIMNSLTELNSKIASISDLKSKNGNSSKTSKAKDTDSVNALYGNVLKMDSQDAAFFLSLTDNQQMTAQASQLQAQTNLQGAAFDSVKSEATQKTVQVSQTLIDALNDSAKNNKAFRIDFDNDIAVVMKVDKGGVISANFIPGSAAVESYLKNNISTLIQNFEDKNLPYNQLSYSNREKGRQQEQQKNNKEKDNE